MKQTSHLNSFQRDVTFFYENTFPFTILIRELRRRANSANNDNVEETRLDWDA